MIGKVQAHVKEVGAESVAVIFVGDAEAGRGISRACGGVGQQERAAIWIIHPREALEEEVPWNEHEAISIQYLSSSLSSSIHMNAGYS
jgi:hypothetical protein